MYNLYFKGLSADNKDINKLRDLFKENGLELTNAFDSYEDLAALSKDKIYSEINDKLIEVNPTMQDVNLICHSMGCNIGALATEKSNKIKKLILISPEFGEYSSKEKAKLEDKNIFPTIQSEYGEKSKINLEKFRSLIVFKRTKPLATLAIERINIPTLIIYSKDDDFIPKEYLNSLSKRKDNIEIKRISAKLHNPLSSKDHKQKTIKLIKNFLN